jgi:NADP-dependent 3-hydroxy acid dehydrogenase YdfG
MSRGRKVAWVTGASSGIGLAAARELAASGYRVALSARDPKRLEAALDSVIPIAADAMTVPVDVTHAHAVKTACERIFAQLGRIDLLIANAGTNVAARAWGQISANDFDDVIRLNLNGVFYCVDAALPYMRSQKGGVVIIVASWAGVHVSEKPGPAYTAGKHAAVALAESLNWAEFGNGVRACALCPGEVATPAMARRKSPLSAEAMSLMLQPEDVARAIRFVADTPPHVTMNQLVLSPTWNGAFGASNDRKGAKT